MAQREVHRRLDDHRRRRDRDRRSARRGLWTDSLAQDGTAVEKAHVAELTGINQRLENWNAGLRLLVRRTKPSAGTPGTSPRWRNGPAGGTRSSAPTSPGSRECPARTNRDVSTPCIVPTPKWKTESARTRPWACATCPRSPGPLTGAESSPGTSPPALPPGPATARPARPARLRTRRTRHAALPAAAPTRETGHPHPPPCPACPRDLALGPGVHPLLATPQPGTTTDLTTNPCHYQQKGRNRGSGTSRVHSVTWQIHTC